MQLRACLCEKGVKGWRKRKHLLFVLDAWTVNTMKIAFLVLVLFHITFAGRNDRLRKGGNSPARGRTNTSSRTSAAAAGSATPGRRTPSPSSDLGAEMLDVPHSRFANRPAVRGRGKKRTQSQGLPAVVNLDDTVSLSSGGESPIPRRHSAPPRRHGDAAQAGPVAGPSGVNNRPQLGGVKSGKKKRLNPKTPQPPRRAFHDAVNACS